MAKDRYTTTKTQLGKSVVIIPITVARNGFYTYDADYAHLYEYHRNNSEQAESAETRLIDSTLRPIRDALERAVSELLTFGENGEIRIELTVNAEVDANNERTLQRLAEGRDLQKVKAQRLEDEAGKELMDDVINLPEGVKHKQA